MSERLIETIPPERVREHMRLRGMVGNKIVRVRVGQEVVRAVGCDVQGCGEMMAMQWARNEWSPVVRMTCREHAKTVYGLLQVQA